jgi:MOSC domain-containing protein YiiM
MGRLAGIARRDKKRASMETFESAVISEETGVANDFRGKPGPRQVTLLSAEVWENVCAQLGEELPWTTRRANLLVDGLELPRKAGDIITVGTARLLVTMEADPCSRMEEQCAGLKAALEPDWRGGVTCRVLQGGSVSIGDSVTLSDDNHS